MLAPDDLKEAFLSGLNAEKNTPAGHANVTLIFVLGGIIVARNLGLPDAAVAITAILTGQPLGAFTPPALSEILLLIAVLIAVGVSCIIGLGLIEVRKQDVLARALGIERRRKRRKKS